MKYILREIGWIYNDSTYDNDGYYRTIKIFETENEAKTKKRELEFEYFLKNLYRLHRYESYGEYKQNYKNYKARVTNYLVEKYDLNPTIQLIGHYGYSASMFLKELTADDVQEILNVMNINFFSIIEIENKNKIQYEAKINSYYYDGVEEYLWDWHGNSKLRFDTKLDAFKRFIDKEYHFHHFTFNKNPKIKGTLSEISNLPNILNSLIHSNKNIHNIDIGLTISQEISAELLLQLNELLKEPILIFIEVEITNLESQFDDELLSIKNMNKEDKEIIYEQSYQSLKNEDLKYSEEYLINYSFQLSMDQEFFKYKKIIEDYLFEKTGRKLSKKYDEFFFNESLIQFYGVIKTLKTENEKKIVEGCFGYGHKQILSTMKTAYGVNEDLETAFEESLKNWLYLYGDEYIEYLNKKK